METETELRPAREVALVALAAIVWPAIRDDVRVVFTRYGAVRFPVLRAWQRGFGLVAVTLDTEIFGTLFGYSPEWNVLCVREVDDAGSN